MNSIKTLYKLMEVSSRDLEIPDAYQRKLNTERVAKIVAGFNERIANEPKVSFRDGHYYNEEDPLCQKLKECLLEQFRILHDEKFVRTFFVGGALGVDMWAGEQLLTLRAQTGYEDIIIIVVIPFIGYDSKWPDQSRHRLKKLIQNANDSIVISHSADVSSYKKRNYYMVDHAEYIIGVFDNQKKLRSGTAQTVNYALHQGKVITLIHPDTMEITTTTT